MTPEAKKINTGSVMGRPITASMIGVGLMPEAGVQVLSLDEPHKNIQQTKCKVSYLCCGKQKTITIQAVLRRAQLGVTHCASCGNKKNAKSKADPVDKSRPIKPPPDDVPGWGRFLTNG